MTVAIPLFTSASLCCSSEKKEKNRIYKKSNTNGGKEGKKIEGRREKSSCQEFNIAFSFRATKCNVILKDMCSQPCCYC